MQGQKVDFNETKPFYANMAEDVKRQKQRLGGNFAIAQAVTSREIRNHIRKFIPECIFIIFTLTKEGQKKRIEARHGTDESSKVILDMMQSIYDLYESPENGEKHTYNVNISENMTPDDVLEKVLTILETNYKSFSRKPILQR